VNTMTTTSERKLTNLAKFILREAKRAGATDCDVQMRVADSVDTSVRMGEVEALETAVQSRTLVLRTFVGQNHAKVTSTNFGRPSLKQLVDDTVAMARASEPDPDAGLPNAEHLASANLLPDLGLFDASVSTVVPERKIELALAAEAAARAFDRRITNSEGGGFSDTSAITVYGSSRGFIGSVAGSMCTLQASVIASAGDEMQSGAWWHQSRSMLGLESPESIGQEAARRALRSLGARKVASQVCPVVFDPRMAADLIQKLAGAAYGQSIFRNSSFLVGKVGEMVANPNVTIIEVAAEASRPARRGRGRSR